MECPNSEENYKYSGNTKYLKGTIDVSFSFEIMYFNEKITLN